jgi:myo-inositol-1(or 4)-monophosphatase
MGRPPRARVCRWRQGRNQLLSPPEATPDFTKEQLVAEKAAKRAGTALLRMVGRIRHIRKKGRIDLVTEADLRAERIILDVIQDAFPGDNILSEEAGARSSPASARTWIIDPLDGTTNFAHGFPLFAVSIALHLERQPVLGVVYIPSSRELFEASKGRGAFLNKRPIRVSAIAGVGDALLGTGFPYYVHEQAERLLSLFGRMIVTAQGVRRPGAASIDLAYVAAGRLDGFWEEGLKPWDTAAGVVLVEEAGGVLSTFGGAPYSPFDNTIVAANPAIHAEMLKVLREPKKG